MHAGDDAFNRALQALHPSVLTQLQRANDVTTFVLELKEALGATLSDGASSAFQPGLAEDHKLPSPAVYRHVSPSFSPSVTFPWPERPT